MKLLFDTHAFIWWDGAPANLSTHVLLIAQAIVEGATLISNDPILQKYSAKLVW